MIFLFLVCFMFGSQFLGQTNSNLHLKGDNVDSVIVYKINSNLTTVRDIECNSIRMMEDAVRLNVTNHRERILNNLNGSKYYDHKFEINARAQILIYGRGKVDTVCTCNLPYISFNNGVYEINNSDTNYLLDSMYMKSLGFKNY